MGDLTRLGGAVSVELDDGSLLDVRGSLLYDTTGVTWPKCSVLIAPFKRSGRVANDAPKFARKWLGREPMEGTVRLPPRDVGLWRKVGPVRKNPLHDGGI